MRNTMLVSVAIYVVALLGLTSAWGNHGLWAALMVLNTARAVTMALRYRNAELAAS
jgi:MATE family multidrug resistance protein